MTRDLWTVAWKEWRSLVAGRAKRQLLLTAGMLAVYAVIFPIRIGAAWVTDPVPMGLVGVALPVVIVGLIVPDSIAGERERRTLGVLLASRLPDRAILFGKVGFAVAVGWLSAPAMLAVALLAANLVAGGPGPRLYNPGALAGVLAISLLVAMLTGAIGIHASLRSRSTQEAQQITLGGLMVPGVLAGFAVTFLLANRGFAAGLVAWLGTLDAPRIAVGVAVLLAAADLLLLVAADRRFSRERVSSL